GLHRLADWFRGAGCDCELQDRRRAALLSQCGAPELTAIPRESEKTPHASWETLLTILCRQCAPSGNAPRQERARRNWIRWALLTTHADVTGRFWAKGNVNPVNAFSLIGNGKGG